MTKIVIEFDEKRIAERQKSIAACRARIEAKLKGDPGSKWAEGWRDRLRQYDDAERKIAFAKSTLAAAKKT